MKHRQRLVIANYIQENFSTEEYIELLRKIRKEKKIDVQMEVLPTRKEFNKLQMTEGIYGFALVSFVLYTVSEKFSFF